MAMRWCVAVIALALSACSPASEDTGHTPRQGRTAAYVDSGTCGECHREAFDAWTGSHHDLAMGEATSETVLGDFDDTTFTHFGVTSRFFTQNGRFFVNTEGPAGEMADFELRYTFGVEPLQQYLAPFPGGRLQSLPIAWDTEQGRWFHLYPDEPIAPDDLLHWTGRYQTWNVMCAECHSTNLHKNYDLERDAYNTVWAEIDVGCQACHGPGAAHVAWARGENATTGPNASAAGLVVDVMHADASYELAACAACHSRRQRITHGDRYGQTFLDDFRPATLRDGLYHPDGQILDEVYVWGSFVQSKMHTAGVRCSNCHEPHGLGLRAPGNAVCVQCHSDSPVERFTTLEPKDYDTPDHHFHETGTVGAQCVGCHMPSQTYMVIDSRHDHSFRIPRPGLSMSIGSPNACTICHDDRPDEWTIAQVDAWWGSPDTRHFGETIASARFGQRNVEASLIAVASDITTQPPIVRATALEHLRLYGPLALNALAAATTDGDPLVRLAAAAGLERLPLPRQVEVLAPLLNDPVRAVRTETARVLASTPRSALDAAQANALELALVEFIDAQMVSADMPAAHLNLGLLRLRDGDLEGAEERYQTALRLDPYFLPARFNLVNLYNQLGRNDEAEELLQDGITRAPDEGELHYSLGLLLAEEQRFEDAVKSLARAADLIPTRARVRYNYGLALQQLGRFDEAEAALVAAHEVDPRETATLFALTQLLMAKSDWARAREYAQTLLDLDPSAADVQRLLNEIQLRQLRERSAVRNRGGVHD